MNIFISGTDTNVGKTVVTAGLAYLMSQNGFKTAVYKPVQTGSELIGNKYYSPDIETVKKINTDIVTKVSYNFKYPVAPYLAAQLDKINIDSEFIKQEYLELVQNNESVIVEGVGGILVPIANDFLVRDLIKLLDIPLIIVARPDLGTINHTLLTIEAAKKENLKILGVIISGYPSDIEDEAIKHAPQIIEKFSGEKIIGIVPKIENIEANPSLIRDIFKEHINMDLILKLLPIKNKA